MKGAKRKRSCYFDERKNKTRIRQTHTTTVKTSDGKDKATTVIKHEVREEHCPVLLDGIYILTLLLLQGEGGADPLSKKLLQVLIE